MDNIDRGSEIWCRMLAPPPLPEPQTSMRGELIQFIQSNSTIKEAFTSYNDACNRTIDFQASTTPSSLGIAKVTLSSNATVNIGHSTSEYDLEPLSPTTNISKAAVSSTASSASSGVIVVLVLLAIAIVIGVICGYLYWKKRQRTHSIKNTPQSLPLDQYANTNYLDNKARSNQCWKPSTQTPKDPPPPHTQRTSNEYVDILHCKDENTPVSNIRENSGNNRESADVASPRKFDSLNTLDIEKGHYNPSYNDDKGDNLAYSPGVNSNTPLFDDVDGVLPNVPHQSQEIPVENKHNKTNGDSRQSDSSLHNGQNIPPGRLPPIDKDVKVNIRSPKKKKSVALKMKHKSSPVEGIEDISKDMTGNRKSC